MAIAPESIGASAIEVEPTPRGVLSFAVGQGLKFVDLKFTDLPGTLQHFSVPLGEFSEDAFEEGVGFDGSSIRGFQQIQESDMLLVPDPSTAIVDPIYEVPTLSITCNVMDPVTREMYSRDPRYIAQKAERYLADTGIATQSFWGPEAEFYIFDDVRFDSNEREAYYHVDSEEGIWNSGRDAGRPNLGHRPKYKQGYFPAPPLDTFQDLRSRMVLAMEASGIRVEAHHHEVGTAGQAEIDLRFAPLTRQGDQMQLYKYIIKNIARAEGKTVTFMPKPLFNDNGSGMHVHQSLWNESEPLFFDASGYGQISPLAKNYIAGLLEHAPALLAFCAPTTNSYRRLVPGFEAPVNLVYSQRNRSACVRIPMYSTNPKSKRVEFRCPDPSANIYLAFAAMLMAGLDGVERGLTPPAPIDEDLYDLPTEQALLVKHTPGSLDESLRALEADHDFLLKGGVFTPDLIDTYIGYKRETEVDPVALRPHPYEFHLYYDV
jgi:glutamine synthetase